jgi:hypothetical protein
MVTQYLLSQLRRRLRQEDHLRLGDGGQPGQQTRLLNKNDQKEHDLKYTTYLMINVPI